MKRGPKKNEEIICKIKELLSEGLSYSECARDLGVSRQRVHQICIANGLVKNPKPSKPLHPKFLFGLGHELYFVCKEKFRRKEANTKHTVHSFELIFEDLEWPDTCPVLGIPLDYLSKVRVENSPSFDRVDSSLGYVPGNVVIVSWRANRIKSDGTEEEHRKIADYLSKRS